MNTIKEKQTTASGYGQEVSVVISGCGKGDARMVFDVLRAAFTTDRASVDVPQDLAGSRPTAWAVTVDVTEARVVSGAVALDAPVSVDVQGGYWAVEQLRRSLAHAFDVQVVGTVSGDQEEEVRLRLRSRSGDRPEGHGPGTEQ
ncbi:hypothetical protein ACFYW1_24595 [Streptomyces sp. NPDC002669]|uniref:hypothetical protein n=1 Tax=Streptomyces sp. NPDC002669 TaxID=3364658 RepID=UPI00367B7D5A